LVKKLYFYLIMKLKSILFFLFVFQFIGTLKYSAQTAKLDSLKNRIVIFDSNLEHTGTSCTNQFGRLVINFNYFTVDW